MGKKLVYLNNAATSWPKPKSVIDAVADSLRRPYNDQSRGIAADVGDYLEDGRCALAKFFKAPETENIIFTANATHALNTLIHGFASRQKGRFHAITTELEHNAVLRPLNTLRRGGKIGLTIVPFDKDGYVRPKAVKEAVRDETKLMVMTHGSNVLGTVQDVARIGRYMKSRGIFLIVDAAQTAGHVDIDLSRLSVDALAFTGHKSLFGLPGIGGFYIDDPSRVDPYLHGGTGSHSQNPYQPDLMPLKYEAGTHNYPGVVSLQAGVGFIEKTGLMRIGEKTMALTGQMIRDLSAEENVEVYTRKPDLPIVSFNIGGLDNSDAGYVLQNRDRIICRTGLHCAPLAHKRMDGGRGCVRFSPSYFNTAAECRSAAAAVRRLAANARRT